MWGGGVRTHPAHPPPPLVTGLLLLIGRHWASYSLVDTGPLTDCMRYSVTWEPAKLHYWAKLDPQPLTWIRDVHATCARPRPKHSPQVVGQSQPAPAQTDHYSSLINV